MRRNEKMVYWAFRIPAKLKAEAIKCAIKINENDSEYIRKAVEKMNAEITGGIPKEVESVIVEKKIIHDSNELPDKPKPPKAKDKPTSGWSGSFPKK